MNDALPSLGEGFAFFRWHWYRFPADERPHHCFRHVFCWRLWEAGYRA